MNPVSHLHIWWSFFERHHHEDVKNTQKSNGVVRFRRISAVKAHESIIWAADDSLIVTLLEHIKHVRTLMCTSENKRAGRTKRSHGLKGSIDQEKVEIKIKKASTFCMIIAWLPCFVIACFVPKRSTGLFCNLRGMPRYA